MRKQIRSFSIIVAMVIMLVTCSFSVSAETVDLDGFLLSKGVPEEIIEDMSEGQKETIFQNVGEDAVFESYNVQTFSENEAKRLEQTSDIFVTEDTVKPFRSGSISSSDLKLTVVAFNEGGSRMSIYPSCIWNKLVHVKNDTFAMALYPNWEVVPGKNGMTLWAKNASGSKVSSAKLYATSASSAGYAYKVPSNVGTMQSKYEGNAFLYADKKSSSATRAISLQYIDDRSWPLAASYGVSIGWASVSVTGNTSDLYYMAGNYYF